MSLLKIKKKKIKMNEENNMEKEVKMPDNLKMSDRNIQDTAQCPYCSNMNIVDFFKKAKIQTCVKCKKEYELCYIRIFETKKLEGEK